MGNVYEDDFVDVWEHGFGRLAVLPRLRSS